MTKFNSLVLNLVIFQLSNDGVLIFLKFFFLDFGVKIPYPYEIIENYTFSHLTCSQLESVKK